MAFNLERAPAMSSPGRRVKRPRLNDLVKVEQGPRPRLPRLLPETADIEVAIFKYCCDAAVVWDVVKESGLTLWQLQLRHEAKTSALVNFYDTFTAFLKQDPSMPQTLKELEEKAFVKLAINLSPDAGEACTFVRWRPCFYVAGHDDEALHNCLYLIDDLFAYIASHGHEELAVTLYPHTGVNVNATWDVLAFPNYTLNEPDKKLPMCVFEGRPIQGRRIMSMDIQIEGDGVASFLFYGATWPFRSGFEEAGLVALRDDASSRTYNVLKSLSVSEGMEPIMHVLDDVLKGLVCRVVVEGSLKQGTAMHACVQVLRGLQQLHFV